MIMMENMTVKAEAATIKDSETGYRYTKDGDSTSVIPILEAIKEIEKYEATENVHYLRSTLADYLVGKGLPFRSAYKTVGQIVGYCVANKTILEDIPLEKYKEFEELFDEDLYKAIDLENCVNLRISAGGTGIESVKTQIAQVKEFLHNEKGIY